jgi:Flp pilus assembly protein TadG
MYTPKNKSRRISSHRGATFIYVLITMTALFAMLGLAVDMARAQVAKTELHRLADAAARAAVASLSSGTTAAQNAAIAVANENPVDGGTVTLSATNDIQVGNWNSSTSTFTSGGTPYNAVRVYARRTAANGNPISTLFSKIIGINSVDVWTSSTAALVTVQAPKTIYVSAHANPWLAGEPKGTLASVPDPAYNHPSSNDTHPWEFDVANPSTTNGSPADTSSSVNTDSSKVESTDYSNNEPWASPSEYSITVTPNSIIQVSVPSDSSDESNNQGYLDSGSVNTYANGGPNYSSYANDAAAYYGANSNPNNYSPPPSYTGTPNDVGAGNASSASDAQGEEHGMSNVNTPINSVVGVFQNGAANDTYSASSNTYTPTTTVPPGLDFSQQSQRDYTQIEPQDFQTFYVGNGQTSGGTQQSIVVPAGATQLYLGTMDGHEWSNNLGGFNVTITQLQIETVQ